MTRRTFAFAALALAAATSAAASPAFAGGGVRLSFGGPLGTFVATPTPGYGATAAPHKVAPRSHLAKRATPAYTAERRKSKPAHPVVPVRLSEPAGVAKSTPVTASVTQAPGLLGRTLAGDGLPLAEPVRILPPAETIVAREGPVGETATVMASEVKAAPAAAAADKPVACRKFIPAVGITVTVACD